MGKKAFTSWLGLGMIMALAAAAGLSSATVRADESVWRRSGDFAIGLETAVHANNIGTGLRLDSPRFLDDRLYLTLSGGYADVLGIPANGGVASRYTYGISKLGIGTGGFIGLTPIRAYVSLGPAMLWAPVDLSSSRTTVGFFGNVGIEMFLPRGSWALFMELGELTTGLIADQLQGSPSVADGLDASVGLEWFL